LGLIVLTGLSPVRSGSSLPAAYGPHYHAIQP